MIHFSFIATDSLDLKVLNDLETRIDIQETVLLESFNELEILLNLFETSISEELLSEIQDVTRGWLLSSDLKIFNEENFDIFYQIWLQKTGRDNNMDEYGQLRFLKDFVLKLNSAKYKVLLQEAI